MQTCSVVGCEKKTVARGYCGGHYKRASKGQPVDVPLMRQLGPPPDGKCTHPGCDRRYSARGYCSTHLGRLRSGLDMDAPVRGYKSGTLLDRMNHYTQWAPGPKCWLWTGTQDGHGYGLVWDQDAGKDRYAHVVAWELFNEDSAGDRTVRHDCDTPLCVRGHHLLIGTQADNNQDCINRDRRNPSPNFRRGQLRPDEVKEIRCLHDDGLTNTAIARRFNTTRTTVSRVVRRLVFDDIR